MDPSPHNGAKSSKIDQCPRKQKGSSRKQERSSRYQERVPENGNGISENKNGVPENNSTLKGTVLVNSAESSKTKMDFPESGTDFLKMLVHKGTVPVNGTEFPKR